MKTIFVTVKEFIDNGGVLVEGRHLFEKETGDNDNFEYIFTDTYMRAINDLYIDHDYYVSVPCIPQYV